MGGTRTRRRGRVRRKNNEGSVFFRKDRKKWIAQATINGKPVTRSADTKEGAEELLLQLLRLVRQHAAESTSEQSLGQYLASWLERKRLHRDIRPHTYQCYVGRLRHVVDMIGTYPLEDLKPAHFTDAWTDLLKRHYSPTSVHSLHVLVRAALAEAVNDELIPRNPLDKVRAPSALRVDIDYLTDEELIRLFDVSEGTRWYALWVVLGTMGLRIGEALGLLWSDIDWQAGRITIDQTVTYGEDGKPVLGPTKTGRDRKPYMGEVAIAALKAHRSLLIAEAKPVLPKCLVFPAARTGGIMHRTVVADALRRDCARSGVPSIAPHALRHTAATSHMAAGTNPKFVQEMLGHSTAQMTLDRYMFIGPGMHQEAMQRMDERLKKELTNGG